MNARLALLMIVVAASASAEPAKPKALMRQVQRYLALRDSGETQRAQRLLAPDARIFHGAREGAGEPIDPHSPSAQWDRELHATVEPEGELRVEGRTVIGTFVERNDFYRLLDVPGRRMTIAFRFDEQGLIVEEVDVPLPPPENADLGAAFAAAREWVERERPHDASELLPSGKLVRSGPTASRWRALLNEWRRATGRPKARAFEDGEVRDLPKHPPGMLDPPEIR